MLKIAGIMSGTSLDGIDVAIIETDRFASSKIEIIDYFQKEYPGEIRERIDKLVNNRHWIQGWF